MANSSLFFTRQVLIHLIKQNCSLETFLRNLKVSRISLTSLASWTNMKLHNIPLTPKLVRMVITKLDLWKVSGPNCVSVVVLKNCESELSYILPELFKTCFPDVGRSLPSVVPVFRNVSERSAAENYHPVSLLFLVSKILMDCL